MLPSGQRSRVLTGAAARTGEATAKSRAEMNTLTMALARALGPEIRVNAVCPGLITTRWFVDGMGAQAFEAIKANYERSTPLGRPCSAEDVAEAVVWLVDGAATVTGELILLDSGMHLGLRPAPPKADR